MLAGHLRILNGRYHVVLTWMENGKQKQKSISTKIKVTEKYAKKRALEKLYEYKIKFDEKTVAFSKSGKDVMLFDYLDIAIDKHLKRNQLSYNTRKNIQERAKFFKKNVKNILLKDLGNRFIEETLTKSINSKNKSDYIRMRSIFNIISQEMYNDKIVEYNLMKSLPNFKLNKRNDYNKYISNNKELEKFLEVIKDDMYELEYLMLIILGLRKGELLGLTFDNIDLNKRILYVRQKVFYNFEEKKYYVDSFTKTKSGIRDLPIPDFLIEKIKERKSRIKENKKYFRNSYIKDFNNFICVDEEGNLIGYDSLNRHLTKLLENNGLKHLSIHGLRHSAATLLYLNGVPLKDIQHYLGHKNIETTANIYSHYDTSRNKEIINKLTSIYKK